MRLLLLPFLLISTLLSAQSVDVVVDFPSKEWVEPFPVTITLNKGKLQGFGKVQLSVNPDYKVTVINREGATFTSHDGQVKFLWMDMPAQETLQLVMLVHTGGKPDVSVSGAFYYMDAKGEPRYESIPQRTYKTIGGGAVAQSTSTSKKDDKQAKKDRREEKKEEKNEPRPEPLPAQSPEPESAASTKPITPPKPVGTGVTHQATPPSDPVATAEQPPRQVAEKPAIPAARPAHSIPTGGLVFRAQLSAQKSYNPPALVGSRLGVLGDVHYDNHEDWHKYTTGEFSNYRAAKTYANELRETNKVPGSFVVGFENGQRITIQRALQLAR